MLTVGIGIDGDTPDAPIILFKEVGKVAALRKHIDEAVAYPLPGASSNGPKIDMSKVFVSQTSMAHTRWATHGVPSPLNCHPHVSDSVSQFSLVHNGIITNYKELKHVLTKRGYTFKTDTDTEVVAVLCQYVYESQPHKRLNFTELIKTVVKELASRAMNQSVRADQQEGSFAFVFKSTHFPDEIVAARRGSPLLIGVKTDRKLKVDFVDVELPVDERGESG